MPTQIPLAGFDAMIPYGRQDISQSDIDAVVAVLRSDFLTQGPTMPRFEEAVAQYCGAQHAVSVNSATSALHIACLALDLGPGDWLWTSPNTFVASANCALYCGAKVDFVDIDPRSYNMSVERLKEKLIQAEKEGRLPKIVMPVHFAGQPCDMQAIHALSQQYCFKIIEDASHALGARSTTEKIGATTHSNMCVFSFHPVKPLTTGEGGMVTTNDPELAERLQRFRSHGIVRDEDPNTWLYNATELGYNYRMTDIQAALGSSQLNRLDSFIEERNEIADRYRDYLKDLPIIHPPAAPSGALHGYHLFAIRVAERARVFRELREAGIGVQVHYVPVHHHDVSADIQLPDAGLPVCEAVYDGLISIPIYPGLTREDQLTVVRELTKAVR
jgi:UDP-4-amino-4,6-dideoxy-N-acetyl-beta-L-altrosamine transaminase